MTFGDGLSCSKTVAIANWLLTLGRCQVSLQHMWGVIPESLPSNMASLTVKRILHSSKKSPLSRKGVVTGALSYATSGWVNGDVLESNLETAIKILKNACIYDPVISLLDINLKGVSWIEKKASCKTVLWFIIERVVYCTLTPLRFSHVPSVWCSQHPVRFCRGPDRPSHQLSGSRAPGPNHHATSPKTAKRRLVSHSCSHSHLKIKVHDHFLNISKIDYAIRLYRKK